MRDIWHVLPLSKGRYTVVYLWLFFTPFFLHVENLERYGKSFASDSDLAKALKEIREYWHVDCYPVYSREQGEYRKREKAGHQGVRERVTCYNRARKAKTRNDPWDTIEISKSKAMLFVVVRRCSLFSRIMPTFAATKSWFSGHSLISSPFRNYRVPSIATARDSTSVVICKCTFAPASSALSLSLSFGPVVFPRSVCLWHYHDEITDRARCTREFRFLSISILPDCHYADAYFGPGLEFKGN